MLASASLLPTISINSSIFSAVNVFIRASFTTLGNVLLLGGCILSDLVREFEVAPTLASAEFAGAVEI